MVLHFAAIMIHYEAAFSRLLSFFETKLALFLTLRNNILHSLAFQDNLSIWSIGGKPQARAESEDLGIKFARIRCGNMVIR